MAGIETVISAQRNKLIDEIAFRKTTKISREHCITSASLQSEAIQGKNSLFRLMMSEGTAQHGGEGMVGDVASP